MKRIILVYNLTYINMHKKVNLTLKELQIILSIYAVNPTLTKCLEMHKCTSNTFRNHLTNIRAKLNNVNDTITIINKSYYLCSVDHKPISHIECEIFENIIVRKS